MVLRTVSGRTVGCGETFLLWLRLNSPVEDMTAIKRLDSKT